MFYPACPSSCLTPDGGLDAKTAKNHPLSWSLRPPHTGSGRVFEISRDFAGNRFARVRLRGETWADRLAARSLWPPNRSISDYEIAIREQFGDKLNQLDGQRRSFLGRLLAGGVAIAAVPAIAVIARGEEDVVTVVPVKGKGGKGKAAGGGTGR